MKHRAKRRAEIDHNSKGRQNRLGTFECLEPRLVLYATTGGLWPHPELITVSFMPDGTDIGGTPSALFGTMNAKWSTETWQKEILRGLQSWAANANLNLSVVSDDGSPFGAAGYTGTDINVQGDKNFGDIRIGACDLGTSLGVALLPPPINGDTAAGDFFLNSAANWSISSDINLWTVSVHEAGHSLGLDHSSFSTAIMYGVYVGLKSTLTSDDIAGIQAIYGVRAQDSFDAVAPNSTLSSATNITTYIDANNQITLTGGDITATSDVDWYKISIPNGAASTMTVRVQSTNLSLLAPKLSLYNSSGSLIKNIAGGYNSTVSITRSISPGQVYYIKADGAGDGAFGTGAYAFQVNLGTAPLPAVAGPNTATPATFSTGGTSASLSSGESSHGGSIDLSASRGLSMLEDLVARGKADLYERAQGSLGELVGAPSIRAVEELHTTRFVSSSGEIASGCWMHLWRDRASGIDDDLLRAQVVLHHVPEDCVSTLQGVPTSPQVCGNAADVTLAIDHLLTRDKDTLFPSW